MRALLKRSLRAGITMAVVLATLGAAAPARAATAEECFDPIRVPGVLHVLVCPADGSGFTIVHVAVGETADPIIDLYVDARQDNSVGVHTVTLGRVYVSVWTSGQVGDEMIVLDVCVSIPSKPEDIVVCRTRSIPNPE